MKPTKMVSIDGASSIFDESWYETTFFYSESVDPNRQDSHTIKLMVDQNLTPLNVHLAIRNFLRVKNNNNN